MDGFLSWQNKFVCGFIKTVSCFKMNMWVINGNWLAQNKVDLMQSYEILLYPSYKFTNAIKPIHTGCSGEKNAIL